MCVCHWRTSDVSKQSNALEFLVEQIIASSKLMIDRSSLEFVKYANQMDEKDQTNRRWISSDQTASN